MPSSLRARPSANSIFVSWGPPRDQTIVVRGYKLGWGIGVADVYTEVLDGKQRHFTIENLGWNFNIYYFCLHFML